LLSKKDHIKLNKAEEKFLNDNKGFFEFLKKFPTKDFHECIDRYCAQSYEEYLKNYDSNLYERFKSDESIGEYYRKNKNSFDGMSPENIETITKALGRSISFYGEGGRLTKRSIKIYTKTFERYDSEKRDGKKPKWSGAFRWATQSKVENGNPLISDKQDREKQKGTFLKFRKRNNLKSLTDFNNYLKKKNYF